MTTIAFHDTHTIHPEMSIRVITKNTDLSAIQGLAALERNWLTSTEFKLKTGSYRLIPNRQGVLTSVIIAVDVNDPLYALSPLVAVLPEGFYCCDLSQAPGLDFKLAALGFGLAGYTFDRYRSSAEKNKARVISLFDSAAVDTRHLLAAVCRVRDLINIPCEDLSPLALAAEAQQLAKQYRARYHLVKGDALLKAGYPSVHMVGRASTREPCFVEVEWGKKIHPTIALIGKGVCFDTGGLDLKDASGMLFMKKDMGGAAHAIALAGLIMQFELPIHLIVLLPCVENAVSGSAYRPGDIIKTRSGQTVEVMNTDAEGRLILSDAFTRALELQPELMIDFATLTGAARVALGSDLPAFFCNHDPLAEAVLKCSKDMQDPLWRMPLYEPYDDALKGKIADLSNTSSMKLAGAITAALFLQRFTSREIPWMHIDCMAWNDSSRPGRPEGGEAMGLRAVFEYLRRSYA